MRQPAVGMAAEVLRKVTVYLPNGQTFGFSGDKARAYMHPSGHTVVEAEAENGEVIRFVDLPHSMTVAPQLVEPATPSQAKALVS